MLGAIIGDIVDSRFEFANVKARNFELLSPECSFTDDTICTVAVADAILHGVPYRDSLLDWCRRYPHPMGAYGGSFSRWLSSPDHQPYDSWGNGAAMRVSPVAWAFSDYDIVLREALATALPTDNHPDGLVGASVVACGIFLLRTMNRPSFLSGELAQLVRRAYGDDYAERVPAPGVFDELCQGCVPLAFKICAEASSFEDALRRAIAYGDSDTLGAIVGSLADARGGIPPEIRERDLSFLPNDMLDVVVELKNRYKK